MEYKQREVSYTEVNTEPGCLSNNWRLAHSWLAHSSSPSSTGCSLLHWRGVSSESYVIKCLMNFYCFIGIQNQSERESEAITSWYYVLHLESMTNNDPTYITMLSLSQAVPLVVVLVEAEVGGGGGVVPRVVWFVESITESISDLCVENTISVDGSCIRHSTFDTGKQL